MKIAGREIGRGNRPYLIAEVSCNHTGDIHKATELIKAAKASGADAVKFQAYEPDTITIDHDSDDFRIQTGPWAGQTLHQLYTKAHTPFAWFPALFGMADYVGITMFASVFDKSSVDMLERLGCPAYKIASMEIVDIPLIKYAASTGKPLIISTGMASDKEIMQAIGASKMRNTAFLSCISSYPSHPSDPGLMRLRRLQDMCEVVGISDHTKTDETAIGATALGAAIIEKHMKLPGDITLDDEFSLTPKEFDDMRHHVFETWLSCNNPQPHMNIERDSRIFRRSLFVVQDIKKGQLLSEDNIRSIRPGYGMPPYLLPRLVGKKRAAVDIKRGTPLSKDLLK